MTSYLVNCRLTSGTAVPAITTAAFSFFIETLSSHIFVKDNQTGLMAAT